MPPQPEPSEGFDPIHAAQQVADGETVQFGELQVFRDRSANLDDIVAYCARCDRERRWAYTSTGLNIHLEDIATYVVAHLHGDPPS